MSRFARIVGVPVENIAMSTAMHFLSSPLPQPRPREHRSHSRDDRNNANDPQHRRSNSMMAKCENYYRYRQCNDSYKIETTLIDRIHLFYLSIDQ
jgi:hypothetical protein